MAAHHITVHIPPELRFFLPARHRGGPVHLPHTPDATLGHTIQSLGIPLTEVGHLHSQGRTVGTGHHPEPGDTVRVDAPTWPQPAPPPPPRLLLDVHPGTLARRPRPLGGDTAHDHDRDHPPLLAPAHAPPRGLLPRAPGPPPRPPP